jgi:hypothetical protein
VLAAAGGSWLTNAEIAIMVTDVQPRTVRAATRNLVAIGVAEQTRVFPATRFRLLNKKNERVRDYNRRVSAVAAVLGIELTGATK